MAPLPGAARTEEPGGEVAPMPSQWLQDVPSPQTRLMLHALSLSLPLPERYGGTREWIAPDPFLDILEPHSMIHCGRGGVLGCVGSSTFSTDHSSGNGTG